MTRATISIPADLLADAKTFRVNLSRLCQASLQAEVARLKAERWGHDNAAGIAEYNADMQAHGLLLGNQGSW